MFVLMPMLLLAIACQGTCDELKTQPVDDGERDRECAMPKSTCWVDFTGAGHLGLEYKCCWRLRYYCDTNNTKKCLRRPRPVKPSSLPRAGEDVNLRASRLTPDDWDDSDAITSASEQYDTYLNYQDTPDEYEYEDNDIYSSATEVVHDRPDVDPLDSSEALAENDLDFSGNEHLQENYDSDEVTWPGN